ncbi:SMP-30/gluconolactonase/LRE family protein [uncultured Chitinophaga sp.]|uniref:SMP-30/gluconolactonase/LRE family protein n=1 Tax=uncultured Chitinophaga sp. TaxID=339340 RepID=UPI00260549D4|nr:SMP-30/gluconolactonase/LRE family protein [uncultured Chitinophaga sp.]
MQTIGTIEKTDKGLEAIINADARVEIIADGFDWSEGPLWIPEQQMLLFSDIPQNKVYKWTPDNGLETYLTPSGYTGPTPRGGELGSNALLLNREGKLVLCQHGDRRLAVMDTALEHPAPVFSAVADNYQGKKFNSPNDVTMRSNGDYFFTDPPYGMEQRENDPVRELPFHGVFKVSAGGAVTLLTDSITRPNGIVFTPDEKTLIVANSDPGKAVWYMFDMGPGDVLTNPRILRDVTEEAKTQTGLPDGMKIDRQGNIFATGPGGIWIFDKSGKLLGKIKGPVAMSNCALAEDDTVLYITADRYVLRVKMR